MTREDAYTLLTKYTQTPALIAHALSVEAVMRYYAEMRGEDPLFWGNVGLLHDIDYERWPEEHLSVAPRLLAEGGCDEATIHAVCSHGWSICSDVKPEHPMEKVLFATDELTGLVKATALMRPSKSVMDLESKSVKKKFKDKAFAAGVSRDIVRTGCEMMEETLDDTIGHVIEAMRKVAAEIGLLGSYA